MSKNELSKDGKKILKKALKIFVCPKLKSDGYFNARDCIEGVKIDDVRKILGVKTLSFKENDKEKDKENDKEKNSTLVLDEIFTKIAENKKELNDKEAEAIVFLYLKKVQITKAENEHYKDYYAKILYNECIGIDSSIFKEPKVKDINDERFKDGIIFQKGIKLEDITSLEKFVSEISKLEECRKDDEILFYRGHSSINYKIKPSLFREKNYKNEAKMYQELLVRCHDELKDCRFIYEYLKKMQHYGLPTRFLDITLNPLIALYFACQEKKETAEVLIFKSKTNEIKYEKSSKVVAYSSLALLEYDEKKELYEILEEKKKNNENNQKESKVLRKFERIIENEKLAVERNFELEDLTKPVFFLPTRNNKRIINQKGAFILFGLDEEIYKEKRNSAIYKSYLDEYRVKIKGSSKDNSKESKDDTYEKEMKVIFYIKKTNKEKIIKELKAIGVDDSFICPEIQDVAEEIKSQFSK